MNNEATIGHAHVHRDDVGSKMGMWLFLFTELLLFGGMFILYASYRFMYPENFKVAAMHLDTLIGSVNTILLLTSSLTVALSIVALQRKQKMFSVFLLMFTVAAGGAFLVNKFFEWSTKIGHGIYPKGPEMANLSDGEVVFYGLYYVMTGLHALHVIVGLIFIGFMIVFILKGKQTFDNHQKLENAGLYWHLVDIIWIFLFPLFYLIH
ncbi:MAG: cytochrome c oxidase subunit 3 [Ignavibacteria bacterium]|nr:cytochrome c oxidase subunit 3 [Ignavibacteria bacterium]